MSKTVCFLSRKLPFLTSSSIEKKPLVRFCSHLTHWCKMSCPSECALFQIDISNTFRVILEKPPARGGQDFSPCEKSRLSSTPAKRQSTGSCTRLARWLTDSTHWYTRGSAESEIAHAGIVECGLHWLAWPGRGFRCFARLCSRLDTGLATRGRLVYHGEHRRSRQNVPRHGAERKHSKKWQSPHKPRFF